VSTKFKVLSIEFKINDVYVISKRDIVESIEKMTPEKKIYIIERLIGMRTIEQKKWNLIISGRLLSKDEMPKEEMANIIMECNTIVSNLTKRYKKAVEDEC